MMAAIVAAGCQPNLRFHFFMGAATPRDFRKSKTNRIAPGAEQSVSG